MDLFLRKLIINFLEEILFFLFLNKIIIILLEMIIIYDLDIMVSVEIFIVNNSVRFFIYIFFCMFIFNGLCNFTK